MPRPEFFPSIEEWAEAIVEYLSRGDRELEPIQLFASMVASLPSPAQDGIILYVPNETGGSVPAYSDGTNWRRVSNGAIVA